MRHHTLGEYLEHARREAGLSIRALADLSGLPKSKIGELLNDQRKEPRPGDLLALSLALEVPSRDLFDRAGVPMPPEAVSVEAFLRTEFHGLPEEAIAEAKASIDAIVARYRLTKKARNKRRDK